MIGWIELFTALLLHLISYDATTTTPHMRHRKLDATFM